MNKSQVINYIIQVVVTDRFHCTYMDPKWPYTHRSPAVRGIFTSWRNVKHACNYFHLNDVWRLRIKYGPGVIPQLIKTINTNEKTVQLHAGNFHYIFNIRTHHTHINIHIKIWIYEYMFKILSRDVWYPGLLKSFVYCRVLAAIAFLGPLGPYWSIFHTWFFAVCFRYVFLHLRYMPLHI